MKGVVKAILLSIIVFYTVVIGGTLIYQYSKASINNEETNIGFVYGVLPYIEVRTNNLVTHGCGESIGIVVRIHPDHWDDPGTHIHELTHVKQSYRGLLIINDIKYNFDPEYAAEAEKEAEEAWITAYKERKNYENENGRADVGNGLNFWVNHILSLPSLM